MVFATNLFFYGEGLLAPRPTPKAGGPPLVLFHVFEANLHSWRPPSGGRAMLTPSPAGGHLTLTYSGHVMARRGSRQVRLCGVCRGHGVAEAGFLEYFCFACQSLFQQMPHEQIFCFLQLKPCGKQSLGNILTSSLSVQGLQSTSCIACSFSATTAA
jgi:hypothetical protein